VCVDTRKQETDFHQGSDRSHQCWTASRYWSECVCVCVCLGVFEWHYGSIPCNIAQYEACLSAAICKTPHHCVQQGMRVLVLLKEREAHW